MKNQVEERFTEFFEKWVCQLDEYLQQLLRVSKEGSSNESEQAALVSKLTAHYKEYYTVKWALAHEDVLVFYCPVWVGTLEIAYSWVTGWKPSMIFRLVDSMRKTRIAGARLAELTEQQVTKIEELRLKIRLEEEKVEREMERQQVAVADRKAVELARLTSRVSNGEATQIDGLVEVALKGLMSGLEKVMKAADCVRLKTLKGILDILNTSQSVNFLAGTCMLQIRLRQWGQKRDGQYAK
ncbi:putative Transcription factor-related [Melia azedarach]|uniref:Transcription factor-related n=1 Tax=Melia azedarach TaxID=155640 RepID=A0ACC1WWY0_MELAZ|nr:putative Transcription factor-related [Melia azedarach]